MRNVEAGLGRASGERKQLTSNASGAKLIRACMPRTVNGTGQGGASLLG